MESHRSDSRKGFRAKRQSGRPDGGSLTDNGLDIGTVPSGIDPQRTFHPDVGDWARKPDRQPPNRLILLGWRRRRQREYAVDGGSGVWSVTAPDWADANGVVDGAMLPQSGFAVFEGASGTVMVDGSGGVVAVASMQFASNGYVVNGDAITLAGGYPIEISVGDGSAAGAGTGTTILRDVEAYSGATIIAGIRDNAALVINQDTAVPEALRRSAWAFPTAAKSQAAPTTMA